MTCTLSDLNDFFITSRGKYSVRDGIREGSNTYEGAWTFSSSIKKVSKKRKRVDSKKSTTRSKRGKEQDNKSRQTYKLTDLHPPFKENVRRARAPVHNDILPESVSKNTDEGAAAHDLLQEMETPPECPTARSDGVTPEKIQRVVSDALNSVMFSQENVLPQEEEKPHLTGACRFSSFEINRAVRLSVMDGFSNTCERLQIFKHQKTLENDLITCRDQRKKLQESASEIATKANVDKKELLKLQRQYDNNANNLAESVSVLKNMHSLNPTTSASSHVTEATNHLEQHIKCLEDMQVKLTDAMLSPRRRLQEIQQHAEVVRKSLEDNHARLNFMELSLDKVSQAAKDVVETNVKHSFEQMRPLLQKMVYDLVNKKLERS